MITPESILAAIDRRRAELTAARGFAYTYKEVADSVELHPAIFSRLKGGALPSEESINKIAAWVGSMEALACEECKELADGDEPDEQPEVEEPEGEDEPDAEDEEDEVTETTVRAVYAVGKMSTSDDPETQADITRAKELIREGAVGVSVSLDLHPDDAATVLAAEKAAEAEDWSKPISEYLPDGFKPRQRVRHTAIVGTPAFADARLELDEDGETVRGVIVFEGENTGDLRFVDLIDIESSRVPSPIIFNKELEGHDGQTVGFLESFEWVERPPSSHRAVLDDEAITASLKPLEFPARYFAQTMPAAAQPVTISQPDAKGYRVINGLAAPKGVCHRSSMACFTFPADPDPKMRHFHTGSLVGLDNGETIRVGALTMNGGHLNPALAEQGVGASQVGNHRDSANKVLALVRAFPTKFGLWIAGVVPPDVTESDVIRALGCSPSVELWPIGGGKRTLVGLHMVPTPAWPVMASAGSATIATTTERVVLAEEIDEEESELEAATETPPVEEAPTVLGKITFEGLGEEFIDRLTSNVNTDLDKMRETVDEIRLIVGALLDAMPIDEIDIPE